MYFTALENSRSDHVVFESTATCLTQNINLIRKNIKSIDCVAWTTITGMCFILTCEEKKIEK